MKHVKYFLAVIVMAVVCGVIAIVIWYFFSNRTIETLTAILFWGGAAIIAIGALLLGYPDEKFAPGCRGTGMGNIDPGDMAQKRELRRNSYVVLPAVMLVGALLISASFMLYEWM